MRARDRAELPISRASAFRTRRRSRPTSSHRAATTTRRSKPSCACWSSDTPAPMRKWIWVAIVLAAVACSKDKDKDKGSSKSGDKQAAPADAALKSPADLFIGKTVTMPEHVAKLKFGMTEAEAKAAHPEVFEAKYGYVP